MSTPAAQILPTESPEASGKSFAQVEHTNSREARHALGTWLGALRPWTHWITLTFGRKEEQSTLILENMVRNGQRVRMTGRTVMHEQAIRNFLSALKTATMEQCHEEQPTRVKKRIRRDQSGVARTLYSGPRERAWSRGDRPRYVIAVEENPGRMGTHVHALVDFSPCSTPPSLGLLRHHMSLQGTDRTIEINRAISHGIPVPEDMDNAHWSHLSYAQKRASYMVKYCLKHGSSELHLDERLDALPYEMTQGMLPLAACS